jgi:hypothetical protein
LRDIMFYDIPFMTQTFNILPKSCNDIGLFN